MVNVFVQYKEKLDIFVFFMHEDRRYCIKKVIKIDKVENNSVFQWFLNSTKNYCRQELKLLSTYECVWMCLFWNFDFTLLNCNCYQPILISSFFSTLYDKLDVLQHPKHLKKCFIVLCCASIYGGLPKDINSNLGIGHRE